MEQPKEIKVEDLFDQTQKQREAILKKVDEGEVVLTTEETPLAVTKEPVAPDQNDAD
jgi:hypothetical protein